ncbi:MAG TPA: helix-turn-helix domain-containing protein [Nocardia sp.]|uniref:TetR/AcrR family transcriptional regulator n=1 Tax=Nocardia TaxID=1817 RepID=UPI0024560E38|nr:MULTISPECIES: helix-turn-helix domain-containing protein [Nocardia]HLS76472.1 helix-turn-helix domain-containing protein [Nocardia sp.]
MTAGESQGAWERRKRAAMDRIQRVAFDLFEEHGYREVTVERVAAAAQVSPSSIYRYFGTKEMLVLYDEADQQILDLLGTAGEGAVMSPADLLALARTLVPATIDALVTAEAERRIARRLRFVHSVPEVRDGQTRQMRDLEARFRAVFAVRCGRDPGELAVRMAAATAIWGTVAALDHWAGAGFTPALREVYTEAVRMVLGAVERIVIPFDAE